jgi:hypothetical protein
MDKKSDKPSRELIVYFVLALLCALLSIFASKLVTLTYSQTVGNVTLDLRWVFWLCIVLSILCLLPLFRACFSLLHQRGSLPKRIDWLFADEARQRTESLMDRLRAKVFSVIGRLVIAGTGIIIVIMLLFRIGVVHNDEVNTNAYARARSLKGTHPEQAQAGIVSLFDFLHEHESDDYVEVLKLVRDLKKVGVKVVLIQLANFRGFRESLRLMRELEETGIVVFATPYGFNFRTADSLGEIQYSKGTLTLSERDMDESIGLSRIKPLGNPGLYYPEALADVTIEILRKYKSYPRDLAMKRSGNGIQFGEFTIPVTRDGSMYSRDNRVTYSMITYRDEDALNYANPRVAKFNYSGMKRPIIFRLPPDSSSVRELGVELQGKIVILSESFRFFGSFGYYPHRSSIAYASAVENMLTGSITRKSETGYLWLSVICVAIAGFIAYRFRMIAAILLMFVLAVCTLLFGSYLYDSQNILVDIFYPLISVAMAMVAFPGIALGRRGSGNWVVVDGNI